MAKAGQPVADLAQTQRLNLAIGLPLHNQQVLTQMLAQIYSPESPEYHLYLTPEQFTLQFGPTTLEYQSLMEFVQTNGLVITGTHPNRLLLDIAGSVADVQRVFHTNLRLYQHPVEPRTFYAPDLEPSALASLPILHISGLDNYLIPHPAGLKVGTAPAASSPAPLVGSGPSGTYRGNDFRGAYARGVALNGSGQMVGLLEFDGYHLVDINSYWTQASLRPVPLLNVTMDGFNGAPGGNNIEVALDIEMVSSMAPGLSQIIVYEAGPTGFGNDVLNRMANDNLAKQLSASWTFPIDANTEQIFLQFAAQGQSYFNASGDGGANAISTPADDPNVTIVGGTVLTTTGPNGAWVSETVWNRGVTPAAASSGGVSGIYPIPSWQQPVDMSQNQGSITMRNVPDVAAIADNVWVTYDGGSSSTNVGGTSCSAPLWAAFIALVNQQAGAFGRPPVGFLNPALYAIGLCNGYSTNFHDITTGNNANGSTPNEFFATPGYDLCTGWGSPFGQNLINTLAPRIGAPVLTNVSSTIISEGCSSNNGAINPGETVTVNFSFKNIGAFKTTNLLAVLKKDSNVLFPSAPQSYGVLTSGGPPATRAFTFTAAGNCGDSITPTLALFDGSAFLGNLTFSFLLGTPLTAFSENFDEATAPALPSGWTTTASNGLSLWVTSTNLHDSAPNAAFADEPPNRGIEELVSPSIAIVSPSAQLEFRNNYNTETDPNVPGKAYDGGVLEIQVGTNSFTDILAAGGSFASGGYVQTISTETNDDNPLAGRRAWGGNSGGFITTLVNLPASAAGKTIQLKWRFAVDTGNFLGGFGWYIDGVTVRDGASCCISSADLAVSQIVSPEPVAPGQSLNYSITVTNLGPDTAAAVVVTNLLPTDAILSSASPGCSAGLGFLLCQVGSLPAGSVTNFSFTIIPKSTDSITNFIQVSSPTSDPNSSNNIDVVVSTIATNFPPVFFSLPGDSVALLGSAVGFQTTAFGIQPLAYQWLFNGTPLTGETQSTLALTNVQPGQMGAYSVVVTNLNGSVTSAPPAQLTVLGPPNFQLTGFNLTQGAIAISFQTVSERTYTLEYKNSLTDPAWTPILPVTPGTGQPLTLQDTNALTLPTRFYRVLAQ